ncbi:MAG: MBL fold metallo-hydrolase [Desulfarculus sp.]|nr:MBL fold metallo-hydrolase [Desulfarculus sp.]
MKLADDLYAYPWTQPSANNCNAYLAGGDLPILIDPGHTRLFAHVQRGLGQDGISQPPQLVVLTHCHPDHLEAALPLQKAGLRVAMHAREVAYLDKEGRQMAASLGMSLPEMQMDILLEEGELKAGQEAFEVLHTPGHSPGHICLYWPRHKALFAGDLIFAQGVGRVDFPGGDGAALKESIQRMAALDLQWLLPGHGPMLKGAENIKRNFELIEKTYFGSI